MEQKLQQFCRLFLPVLSAVPELFWSWLLWLQEVWITFKTNKEKRSDNCNLNNTFHCFTGTVSNKHLSLKVIHTSCNHRSHDQNNSGTADNTGSFICTWAIILGYVSVACFEACAFPTIITYLWPGFLKGYLYTAAGFDVYASWLIVELWSLFLLW